jgi:hypothetical protein
LTSAQDLKLVVPKFWANDRDDQFTDNLLQQASEWLMSVSRGNGRFTGDAGNRASVDSIRVGLLWRLSAA